MERRADVAVAGHRRKLFRICGRDSVSSASLSERKRDQRNGQEEKQVKRAADKVRFGRGANVRVHLACASVRKHFYSKRVKAVETIQLDFEVRFFFVGKNYGRGIGVGRGLTLGAILGVGEGLGVEVGVVAGVGVGLTGVALAVGVGVGVSVAVAVGVGVGPSGAAQYFPPVFK